VSLFWTRSGTGMFLIRLLADRLTATFGPKACLSEVDLMFPGFVRAGQGTLDARNFR
jgi:hypothetical protein